MPSGRVHAKCTAVLAIPAFFTTLGATGSWISGLACGLGCLSGIALTPDLDQEGLSSSEYWLIKWTMGLGFLWTMLWYPYARLCKHRSVLSHFPVLSTLFRLLYLSIFPAIAFAFGWMPPAQDWLAYKAPMLWAIGGLIISDVAHWALDTRFGDWPSRRRRR